MAQKSIDVKVKSPLTASRYLLATAYADGKFRDVHTKILSRMNRDELHLVIRNDNTLSSLIWGGGNGKKKRNQDITIYVIHFVV